MSVQLTIVVFSIVGRIFKIILHFIFIQMLMLYEFYEISKSIIFGTFYLLVLTTRSEHCDSAVVFSQLSKAQSSATKTN